MGLHRLSRVILGIDRYEDLGKPLQAGLQKIAVTQRQTLPRDHSDRRGFANHGTQAATVEQALADQLAAGVDLEGDAGDGDGLGRQDADLADKFLRRAQVRVGQVFVTGHEHLTGAQLKAQKAVVV